MTADTCVPRLLSLPATKLRVVHADALRIARPKSQLLLPWAVWSCVPLQMDQGGPQDDASDAGTAHSTATGVGAQAASSEPLRRKVAVVVCLPPQAVDLHARSVIVRNQVHRLVLWCGANDSAAQPANGAASSSNAKANPTGTRQRRLSVSVGPRLGSVGRGIRNMGGAGGGSGPGEGANGGATQGLTRPVPEVLPAAQLAALAASAGLSGVDCVLVKAVDLGTPEADAILASCAGFVRMRCRSCHCCCFLCFSCCLDRRLAVQAIARM
jgi:hypothetical protein